MPIPMTKSLGLGDLCLAGGARSPYRAGNGYRWRGGEIVDPTLSEEVKQAMFPRLAEVRREELQASARVLKISELRSLGFRDSGMAGTPANHHPDSFQRATFDDAVKRLVSLIRQTRPQVIATYDPLAAMDIQTTSRLTASRWRRLRLPGKHAAFLTCNTQPGSLPGSTI